MKKKCFVMLFVFFICFFSSANAQTIRVGYVQDYGYENIESKSGFCFEYLQKVSMTTGWEFEYIAVDYQTGKRMLTNGELDIFGPVEATTDKKSFYSYSSNKINTVSIGIYVLDDSSIYDFSDVKKISIATENSHLYNDKLLEYAKQKGVSTSITYKDFVDMESGLYSGEYEAVLLPSMVVIDGTRPIEYITDVPVYFAFNINKPELVEQFDIAVAQINGTENSFLDRLNKKYYVDRVEKKNKPVDTTKIIILVVSIVIIISIIILLLLYVLFSKPNSNKKNKKKIAKKLKENSYSYTDELTNCETIVGFNKKAKEKLSSTKANDYTLISIDIDCFKYINEVFGFEKGNEVIKVVAKEIEDTVSDEALITRTFADNFLVLTNTPDDLKAVGDMIENEAIYDKISEILSDEYNIKFSIGYIVIVDPSKDISAIIDCANTAKKEGKGKFKNTIVCYDEKMCRSSQYAKEITLEMEKALHDGEFKMFVQPKYSLITNEIVGAESLVRWSSPKRGVIPPLDFIPLFEKNGFIEKLDLYMVDKTCSLIRTLLSINNEKVPIISVNLSKVSLLGEGIANKIIRIASKYDIDPRCLEIEITESVFSENVKAMIEEIFKMKQAGFWISIDDFGAEYSCLNMLKDIPADIIKLDKEFLGETIQSQKGKNIIKSIIDMAKKLEIKTVAEGIETSEQVETLTNMGCDIGQGYYFSIPLFVDKFIEMLR